MATACSKILSVLVGFGSTVLHRSFEESSLDGIGRYTAELGRSLRGSGIVDIEPLIFSGRKPSRKTNGIDAGSFHRQALRALICGEQFAAITKSTDRKFDLLHATDHFIPKLHTIPVVATLHDAVPLSHPEWISYSFKMVKNALWRRTAHWADHIITVSEFAKAEVANWFGLPTSRISVTPLGVGDQWFQTSERSKLDRVRHKYGLPARFLFFIGTLQPRKNLLTLIEAHRSLPRDLRQNMPLVVAGRAGWSCEMEVSLLQDGDEGALRWLQHVPEDDLLPLFHLASALVVPSLHEGFGLPVLEAFAAGVPVIATKEGAVPEIAGDAATLVDPRDAGALAQAVRRVTSDEHLAAELRNRGRLRAKQFTWERTANLTIEVYRDVLARGSAH